MSNNMNKKARVIAFYLPQFHPIPENDRFWGKGFTEWTNAAKAKPLFKGHHQPHIPADLGFYDLRMPEVREAQAELAREAGVEGFCYWHYWFGNGKQLLQEIFNEVVESGKPNFPFCVGWANHSWNNKNWNNTPSLTKDFYIAEQTYPGADDHEAHFYSLLKAFRDKRYIKVDGKLLFYVYAPLKFPNVSDFIMQWNSLAKREGLPGFFFVGLQESGRFLRIRESFNFFSSKNRRSFIAPKEELDKVLELGFNAVNSRGLNLAHYRYHNPFIASCRYVINGLLIRFLDWHPVEKYDYKKVCMRMFSDEDKRDNSSLYLRNI